MRRIAIAALALASLTCCTTILGVDKEYVLGTATTPEDASEASIDAGAEALDDLETSTMDGGVDADSDAAIGPNGCPIGRGPKMVRIPTTNDGGFCIDETEVTRADYAAFLEAGVDGGQPVVCSWNTSFVPADLWPPPDGEGTYPARFMDWCDAYAFCKWAGKRLCGRVGGGASSPTEETSLQFNQWYASCTSNGAHLYPYGEDYDGSVCNGVDHLPSMQQPVGSLPLCRTDFGVYDQSGNIAEWIDACESAVGNTDYCHTRGGSLSSGNINLSCPRVAKTMRGSPAHNIGFRCCAE